MYSRYRGTHRKLVIQTLPYSVGFFYVQEITSPWEVRNVVWLFGITKFIVKRLQSPSVNLFGFW